MKLCLYRKGYQRDFSLCHVNIQREDSGLQNRKQALTRCWIGFAKAFILDFPAPRTLRKKMFLNNPISSDLLEHPAWTKTHSHEAVPESDSSVNG